MEIYTGLIVPAMSDVAGRCIIVAREGDISNALQDYRADYRKWRQVACMNSRGELVWCEKLGTLERELKACVPLMAGLEFVFEA